MGSMLSIGVVARQTGIEVGTLRKWEDRYGFPQPVRQMSGQRRYLSSDVEKLLVVARRISTGERVSKIIRELNDSTFANEQDASLAQKNEQADATIRDGLEALLRHDFPALKAALELALSTRSMLEFVEEVAGPLTYQVGEYWARGELPIFGEHLFSSVLESLLLREASVSKAAHTPPLVLLTTPAGELHTLGLSMVSAVLGETGVACLRLHGGLPLPEIVAATAVYGLKVVGVSASCYYPPKLLRALMQQLRRALPAHVALWFGGGGVDRVSKIPPGVMVFGSMQELPEACISLDLIGERVLLTEKI